LFLAVRPALFLLGSELLYLCMSKEFTGIWIPKEILEIEDIGVTEKMVLSTILALSKNGGCRANNRYFSELFKISRTRVSIIISNLYKKSYIGYITKVKGGITENEKRVLNFTYRGYLTKVKTDNITDNSIDRKSDSVIHPLRLFISENFPNINQLQAQLTNEECEVIVKNFPRALIVDKLKAMENKSDLKKYTSVDLTLSKWCTQDAHEYKLVKPKEYKELEIQSVEEKDASFNAFIAIAEEKGMKLPYLAQK